MAKCILAAKGAFACKRSSEVIQAFSKGLAEAGKLTASIEARRLTLQAEMEILAAAGIIDASPFYQQGKYLYLIHPMRGGERRREYIGSDQAKIDAALACIERCKIFKAHQEEMEGISRVMGRALADIGQMLFLITKREIR